MRRDLPPGAFVPTVADPSPCPGSDARSLEEVASVWLTPEERAMVSLSLGVASGDPMRARLGLEGPAPLSRGSFPSDREWLHAVRDWARERLVREVMES